MLYNEPSDDDIVELMKQNPIDRNKYLNNIVNIIQNTPPGVVINLDGAWGTGKTILCRQLKYILENKSIKFPDISIIEESTKRNVFYFNSWENDFHNEPLDIFLLELVNFNTEIMDPQDNNIEALNTIIDGVFKITGKLLVSMLSNGNLKIEDFKEAINSNEEHSKSFLLIKERRKRVRELLDFITKDNNLIVIIDELDRCKPTFAVETLEFIKHIFMHDKVSFVITCNKRELANTIKCFYGSEFNGFRYLNRFFNIELALPEIDKDKFIHYKWPIFYDVSVITNILTRVAYFFELSMREINTYCTMMSTFIPYWKNTHSRSNKNYFIEWVFIPYLYGLSMVDKKMLEEFMNGNGFSEFARFAQGDAKILDVLNTTISAYDETRGIEEAENLYKLIVDYNKTRLSKHSRENFTLFENIKLLFDALTMISPRSSYASFNDD